MALGCPTLNSLRNGDFAINSHKKGEPPVYTTCGNIRGQEAAVVMLRNFQFVPEVLEVRAGERARFTITSEGAGHTFTIEALGVDVVLPAGTARKVEFNVPRWAAGGELQIVCRFHSSGSTGMVAKLSVVGRVKSSDY